MPNKTFKTKFKIENKEDQNKVIDITISINLNHSCSDIDKIMDNMTSSVTNTLINYQLQTEKPKKKKKGFNEISNVV